jgi:hypothetical protein
MELFATVQPSAVCWGNVTEEEIESVYRRHAAYFIVDVEDRNGSAVLEYSSLKAVQSTVVDENDLQMV